MNTAIITFETPNTDPSTGTYPKRINEDVEIGDSMFYVSLSPVGTSNIQMRGILPNVVRLGKITDITVTVEDIQSTGANAGDDAKIREKFYVEYDDGPNGPTLPTVGHYFFFQKSQVVNSTTLTGYYADVHFVNNSKRKAELFSVGSEIFESSQ